MDKSKLKFDVANLTEGEKKQRRDGIQFLFNELNKRDANFTPTEAEQLYDKMQQAAIDNGYSFWSHYRTR
jgi:hypothetical protein